MAVLLLFFMLPLETLSLKAEEAKTPVVYREYNIETKEWEIKNCSEYQVLTDLDKTLNEGWYIVSGEVTCNNVLTVEGNVCLILTDECLLAASRGIRVAEGNSITIYAQSEGDTMGKLTAKGYRGEAAGIGGYEPKESNGPITIHGGNITAEGNMYGPGIGGASNGNGKDIIINGGVVTAIGGNRGYGAGIGGASISSYDPTVGRGYNITINGGVVNATGKTYGAGIGGAYGDGTDITINGGTVIATGGSFGAGIGGGDEGAGKNIIINGGTVTAHSSSSSAGIGGGIRGEGTNITINGGIVDAKGAAGIGGGDNAKGSNIVINNGTVTAKGTSGAGIGGGGGDGTDIYINGGTVTAVGVSTGIGGAGLANNSGNGTDIHIKNAVVEASSQNGSAIGGAGYAGVGSNISITNSRVTAISGKYSYAAGIGGGGYAASGTDISIINSYVIVTGNGTSAAIGGGRASSGENISIERSIVKANSGKSKQPFIGGGDDGESINITKENSIIFEGNEGTVHGEAELKKELLGESIEVEIGTDETLAAPENSFLLLSGVLTNNGTFTINNERCLSGEGILSGNGEFILENVSFTSDDIIVPEGMVYTGEDQTDDVNNIVGIDISKYTTKTICDTEFTIKNVDTENWIKSIAPAEVKDAGTYSAVYTKGSDSLSKEFKVAKSETTYNDSEGTTTLKSYEGAVQKNQFIYGSNITLKVVPRLTGTAVQSEADTLQTAAYQEPQAGEIAVFMQKDDGEIQLTEAKPVTSGGEVSFDISTVQHGLASGTYPLSVRYTGTENMADYSEDITVTVNYHNAAGSAVLTEENKGENGWYTGPVTIQAPQGYEIADCNTKDAIWQGSIAAEDLSLNENGDYIYFLKELATGYITDKMILTSAKIDSTKPKFGNFTYKEGKAGNEIFVKIWNWLVGKDYITVTAPITENGSGLTKDNIEIHLVNSNGTDADNVIQNIALTGNTADGYTISFVIPADFGGYYSVTAKDMAGNKSVMKNQRTVIDTAPPEITIRLNNEPYSGTDSVINSSAVLDISVNDSPNNKVSAGLKSVVYSLDKNAFVSLEPESGFDGTAEGFEPVFKAGIEDIKINEKGVHTLYVLTEDHAGNKEEKEIAFQIYYPTKLILSEKSGETVIYDGEEIEEGIDFTIEKEGSEKEVVYSYQKLDSEDSSYKTGLPINSGKYRIKAQILQDNENFYFGAETTLEITIEKIQVKGNSHTIQAIKQKKNDITFDLSSLLPQKVTGTTVYCITEIQNNDGILSPDKLPSTGLLNGSVLFLATEAVEQAGKQAEIIISFQNDNYEISEAVVTIEIIDKIPVILSGIEISGMEQSRLVYSGNAAEWSGTPEAKTEDGQIIQLEASDYQFLWYQEKENDYINIPDNVPPVHIGNYKLVVKVENNNYIGTQEILFEIVKKDISDAVVTLEEELIFNGAVQTQTLANVKAGTLTLTEEEYIITQNTGCEAGSYILIITGTGNFTGTIEKEFKISPLPVKLLWNTSDFVYNGKEQGISAVVSNSINGYEVSVNSYSNETAVSAGRYTAQAAGLDNPNYTLSGGTGLSKEYIIEKLDITKEPNLKILFGEALIYNGKVQTQKINSVKIGDLDVSCDISDNLAVNAGTYTLTVTGIGNFTGTAKADFVILQAENAPNMPDSTMNTAIKSGRKVSDISLKDYTNWIWSTEDLDKILPTKENENIVVTACYQGADKENYKNTSQQIVVTMIKCEHPEEQVGFFTDYEPTCTKEGMAHRYCEKCNIIIEQNIKINALGHSYGMPEFVWSEDFGSAKADFICERIGCAEDEEGHKKSMEAEVTAEVNGNSIIYTARVFYNGKFYTDKKQVISEKKETRLQISEGIADIPEGLKKAGYDTEEKIVEACCRMILGQAGYQESQKVMYDIVLQVSFDGGETWQIATKENFPKEGIVVAVPYPKGTNAKDFDFLVTHMFSHTMNGFQAGEIEMPEVTKTEKEIRFTVKGLSPIMIAWKSLGSENESTKEQNEETTSKYTTDKKPESPATGEKEEEKIWILLSVLSIFELAVVSCSKRKNRITEK